jgi:uncharacterized membrane protein YdbT with pleckstrin-like domain
MDYKELIKEDEKVMFVTRMHPYMLAYPVVFSGVFATVFILGSIFTGEFLEVSIIMSVLLAIYPVIITVLIINSRFVITDQRVIEQTGVLIKRQRFVDLLEIEDVSFAQTSFGKRLRFGDIRIKARSKNRKAFYRIFKFMLKPHEFIVHLNEILNSKKAIQT